MNSAEDTARHYASQHAQGSFPDYEAILERAYGTLIRPGETVVDIGAHGGRHTVRFLDLVGRRGKVYAYEPIPQKAAALKDRFAGTRCTIREKALSSRKGRATFTVVENALEESGLRERIYNIPDPIKCEIDVAIGTLDSDFRWHWGRIDYIKIDIEGGEIDCLEGARRTIARHRPLISIEYGYPAYSVYGRTPMSLYDISRSLGYTIGDLWGNPVASAESWRTICDAAYWDYFIIPNERVEDWSKAIKSAGVAS
jgi:FkbM family methyltransferase